jgi:hypothetical protein
MHNQVTRFRLALIGDNKITSSGKLYSLGLKYMDDYKYEKAYEHFRQAYEKDNSFVEAKKKMEIYKPLIG